MANAVMMYAQDYDETIVPWLIPTGLPRDTARRDRNTWVHLLQPYVKNGDPPRIDNLPMGANLDPVGVWRCPSFNAQELAHSSGLPDCDGPNGVLPNDFPPRQYFAHYGIVEPEGFSGSCQQEDPYFNPPGSDPVATGITGTLAGVSRPAETVLITDGASFISNRPNNGIGVFWGCDAMNAHQRGGNHVFLDGHAKWIRGNSERYELQDASGCWYKKYYTIDR